MVDSNITVRLSVDPSLARDMPQAVLSKLLGEEALAAILAVKR